MEFAQGLVCTLGAQDHADCIIWYIKMRYYASVSAFILRHSTLCLVWSLFWFVYNRFMKSWIMLWMKLKRGMLLRLM